MKPFFVLLISIVVLTCGPASAPAQDALPKAQADAVAAIKKLGGYVQPSATSRDVIDVTMGWRTTDATLKQGMLHMKEIKSPTKLTLSSAQVTDAGLEHLSGLTNLKELKIFWGTKITDAGLVYVKGLTSLQSLYLHDTRITDAGLVHLKDLNSLRYLRLHCEQITDAGLEHLTGLTGIYHFSFRGTQVTRGGMMKLRTAMPRRTLYSFGSPTLPRFPSSNSQANAVAALRMLRAKVQRCGSP